MQLIVAWPNWNTRADRCLMFSNIGEWIDKVYLITAKDIEPSISARLHPNSQIIYLDQSLSGWSFLRGVRSASRKILVEATDHNQQTILHDLAVARLIPKPLGLNINHNLIRTVVSFYSPTVSNWTLRAWRTNRNERLPWKQEFTHLYSVLPRIPMEFFTARFADAVIGNNEQIKDDVIGKYGKNAACVFNMPTEVDTEFFDGERDESIHPKILFCGRLYSRKGVFDLLYAVSMVREQSASFTLQLVGDNSIEKNEIDKKIKELNLSGNVEIIPHQPRASIKNLMKTATVFVLPSYLEGSPRVVKEAMAAGCPVVTYDIPGTRAIDPSGKSLILVPVGDISGLAIAIMGLLNNVQMRRELGNIGREFVKDKYSLPSVSRQIFKLYEALY